ncbi:VC0807 family protein [Actinomycetospora termitidis]|uniref:VC0807 family protein n=1 Tax=Actinomycetospora termitidis TaxID=3053470 RepID=A0ABT7MD44_9PSEU|nr:VC0807 family protein [Actinomycetospora sp. Odt1-22]MDL5158587.1 VC0807 family protein [Actinomycetospora sp. Odt1-22]
MTPQDAAERSSPPAGTTPTPTSSWRTIAWTLVVDVMVPFAAYLALLGLGVHEAAALATAGGVALVRAIVIWIREREVGALSILLVVRFSLGVIAALLTGDARFVLAKDSVITASVGLAILASLAFAKPLIYYIRRSLSPRPRAFDAQWTRSPEFRALNRRMTWVWGLGLITESSLRVLVIYTLPIEVAALLSQAMAALAIILLVAWTQWYGRRSPVDPEG